MPSRLRKIQLKFLGGLAPVPRLGTTVSLRPIPAGLLTHGQNIDTENDEFERGQLLPGPGLTTINGGSNMTGVAFLVAVATSSAATPFEFMYLGEGLLGATNMIRVMTGVKVGGTPAVSATGKTVTHNDGVGVDTGHTSVVLQDMVFSVDSSAVLKLILIGVDGTDIWLQKVGVVTGAAPNLQTIFPVTGTGAITSLVAAEHHLMVGDDGAIYFTRYAAFGSFVGKVATDHSTVTASAFTMPSGLGVSALGKYQTYAALGYCTTSPGTFAERNAGGKSGIIVWDYVHPTQFISDVPCPANHISAIVKRPNGQTLVFGGLDEGKTTIYEFYGYGYRPIVSYVGEMPRNNHSVNFDGQGRMVWLTANGQFMRYDFDKSKLEPLASMDITAGYGGICTALLSGTDYEFLLGGGKDATPDTFPTQRVRFGIYRGDADSANDTVATPLAIMAQERMPPNGIVESVELRFNRNLASGDKVVVRLYTEGDTTPIDFGTVSHTADGAVASKLTRSLQYNIDSVHVGVAWKMADEAITAPGIVEAYLIVREPVTR